MSSRRHQSKLIEQINAQMCCIPVALPLREPDPDAGLHPFNLEAKEINALEPMAFDSVTGELYVSPIYFGAEPMKTYARAVAMGFTGVPVDTADGMIALLPTAMLRRVQGNRTILRGVFARLELAAQTHGQGKTVDVWAELQEH